MQFGIFDHIEGIAGTTMHQLLRDRHRADEDGRRGGLRRLPPRRAPRHRSVHGAEPGDLPRRRRPSDEADQARPAREAAAAPPSGAGHRRHLRARPAHRRAGRLRRRAAASRRSSTSGSRATGSARTTASTRRSGSSCRACAPAASTRPAGSTTTSRPSTCSHDVPTSRRTRRSGIRATPSPPVGTGWT